MPPASDQPLTASSSAAESDSSTVRSRRCSWKSASADFDLVLPDLVVLARPIDDGKIYGLARREREAVHDLAGGMAQRVPRLTELKDVSEQERSGQVVLAERRIPRVEGRDGVPVSGSPGGGRRRTMRRTLYSRSGIVDGMNISHWSSPRSWPAVRPKERGEIAQSRASGAMTAGSWGRGPRLRLELSTRRKKCGPSTGRSRLSATSTFASGPAPRAVIQTCTGLVHSTSLKSKDT